MRVSGQLQGMGKETRLVGARTSRDPVNLVLDVKVYEGDDGAEESPRNPLAVQDCPCVCGARGETSEHPRDGCHEVRDHENVMPVMVIGRRHVRPAAAGKCPEDAEKCNHLGQTATRACRQDIPQRDERKSGACQC